MKLTALTLAAVSLLSSCTYNISVPPEQKKTVASTSTPSKPKPKPPTPAPAAPATVNNELFFTDEFGNRRAIRNEDPLNLEPAKTVQLEVDRDR
jgi:hypothetical protein